MEKESLFNNELNCSSFFVNINNPLQLQDQSDPFESALSSMVSSPTAASNSNPNPNNLLRELIGRLGTICNSGDISPYTAANNNTSCYSTPLNSPPKLNLSVMEMELDHQQQSRIRNSANHFPFSPDPGFAERAARFSCFADNNPQLDSRLASNQLQQPPVKIVSGSNNSSSSNPIMAVQESRGVDSDKKFSRLLSTPDNVEFADSRENSSVSEQISPPPNDANCRKRKSSIPKGKESTKDTCAAAAPSENSESGGKRSKSEDGKEKDKSKGSNSKENAAAEAPKDYIHVRARRGQATDAHSLAERVRREKISERMKVLQDLVPGCNKVTGKAVMLDEIINYVQSLQRQVEFLSMKLAAVNPRMDADMEAAAGASKDVFECRGSMPHNMYQQQQPWESHHLIHSQLNLHNNNPMMLNPDQTPPPNTVNGSRNQSLHLMHHHHPFENYSETAAATSQVWEDDLHSFVQMGFGQNQAPPTNGHGGIRMKVEL